MYFVPPHGKMMASTLLSFVALTMFVGVGGFESLPDPDWLVTRIETPVQLIVTDNTIELNNGLISRCLSSRKERRRKRKKIK